jgi:alginate O-acetyltransferase complex protein AlgI
MFFNSFYFLIFFAVVLIIYFKISNKHRLNFLLLSSIIFYVSFIPWHILILLVSVVINFYISKVIFRSPENKRKMYLIIAVIINLCILSAFKYVNFFNENISALARLINWNYSVRILELAIPVGISFFTFKSLSYLIEVYRKKINPLPPFKNYLLYIIIFPELLAGPIDRPNALMQQFDKSFDFDYARVSNGLKLIGWGFFQKWVIADRLALFVNSVYGTPEHYSGIGFLFATVFFAFQIYCDFSAYSDIAIGAGEILGFKFAKNFSRPYFSKSISEFWRRWHITLSSWFRDYLFLPVAYTVLRKLNNKKFLGVKPETWGYLLSAFITMVLAGLWHGAGWTFVLWGLTIWFFLFVSFITKRTRDKINRAINFRKLKTFHKIGTTLITFCLTCLAWIFFRANDFNDAIYIFSHLFTGMRKDLYEIFKSILSLKINLDILTPITVGFAKKEFLMGIMCIVVIVVINLMQRKGSIRQKISTMSFAVRWAVYVCFIIAVLLLGKFDTRQFIYIQF